MNEITDEELFQAAHGISKLTDRQVNEAVSEMLGLQESRDHTGPVAYFKAMAVAMEQEWWGDFVYNYISQHLGYNTHSVKVLFNPEKGFHALALYLYFLKRKDTLRR